MKAKWLNALLVAIPFAFIAWFLNRQGTYSGQLTGWIFAFALVGVVPLAGLLGHFTDKLAMYFGDRIGGLLGASFGNVPELAIGLFLLIHAGVHAHDSVILHGDFDVIRGLLIGSVINNVLFVLGSSIFLGALRNGRMTFSAVGAAGYASMMALAVVGLALPTLAISLADPAHLPSDAAAIISVPFGIILILSYVAYLAANIFNVGAHPRARQQNSLEHAASEDGPADAAEAVEGGLPLLPDAPSEQTMVEKIIEVEDREEDDEVERRKRRELRRAQPRAVWMAISGLAVVTGLTVLVAALLVSVTDNVIRDTPLTPLSTGLVLFPIVCNLGEQAGSIITAWRNHMEGAMSLAAGSSVQVALFVTPVLVLLSYPISGGAGPLILTLIFKPLELIVLGLVAFVYALVSLDGETTWLEGLQLLAFYSMIVAVAFVLPGR